MNGHSKMKLVGIKSRSIDLGDLLPFPLDPEIKEATSPPKLTSEILESKENNTPTKTRKTHAPSSAPEDEEEEEEEAKGEVFGVILNRNSSVSSSAAAASHWCRIRPDKQGPMTSLHNAVRKAFSMRRSSSVSERYCRIHDQCVTLTSPPTHEDDDSGGGMENNSTVQTRSRNKGQQHRTAKILRACKRIFRL